VRRLVRAAVVDPPVAELDRSDLHGRELHPSGVAEFTEQHPVRPRNVVLPGIGPGDASWGDLIANDFGVGPPTTQRAVTTDLVSR